ncbi:MAG: hypothetical protein LH472_01540 [Pyrinomonadaceae bacterium]|nr:hypothetical protein [Pyrinomonadaceae bacterium]
MTKKINNEAIDTAIELTQKTASLTLKGAVQTAEVTENYVQGMYVAGYNANVEALKVAKTYWDATSQIRQDWIQLFATTGENFIKAAGRMELPLQKEVVELGRNLYTNVENSVENMNKQAKAATK